MKTTIEFPMFCTRQITMAKWFERFHIIKVVDFVDVNHPITNKFCMKVFKAEVSTLISNLVFDAIYSAIDETGKNNRDELVRIGYITHNTRW